MKRNEGIDVKQIKEFFGKFVNIGVPHFWDENKLFIHSGYVTKITPNWIVLKTAKGIIQIKIEDVRSVTVEDNILREKRNGRDH